MKVNITGLLRQAANTINPDEDRGAYAYMLREVADHVEDGRAGRHTLAEFADCYCMNAAEAVTADVTARPTSIALTPAEIQSGLDRVRWAELLIRQLPETHDGRNSWLLNFSPEKADELARRKASMK